MQKLSGTNLFPRSRHQYIHIPTFKKPCHEQPIVVRNHSLQLATARQNQQTVVVRIRSWSNERLLIATIGCEVNIKQVLERENENEGGGRLQRCSRTKAYLVVSAPNFQDLLANALHVAGRTPHKDLSSFLLLISIFRMFLLKVSFSRMFPVLISGIAGRFILVFSAGLFSKQV